LGNHSVLINSILKKFDSLEYELIDGGIFIDTFLFEIETGEITFRSSGGPGTRIAKLVSVIYPDTKIRISWLSDSFNGGVALYRSGEAISN
jgi:hypothetical protein